MTPGPIRRVISLPNRMIYVPSEIPTGRAGTIVAVSPRFTDYTLVNKNRAVATLRVTTPLPIVNIALYLYNGYYDNLDTASEWLRGMGFSTTTIDTDSNRLTYMYKNDGQGVPIVHLTGVEKPDTGVRTIEYYRMMAMRNLDSGPYSW